MNRPLLIAIIIGVCGIAGIAMVSGGGDDNPSPIWTGSDRAGSAGQGATNGSNDGLRLLSDSRASLRVANGGRGLGSYDGPLAAEQADRFDESLATDESGSAATSRRIDQSRANQNRATDLNRDRGGENRSQQQNRQTTTRPGAGAGGGSNPSGMNAPAPTPLGAQTPPGANPSGPTGPDLSRLPPGLIIPDGLPQSVIDVLIDAADRGVFDGVGGGGSGGGGGGGGGGGTPGGGGGGGGGGTPGGGGGGGGGVVIGGGGGGGGGPFAQLVWVNRSISGCSALSGQRTRDLYVRLLTPTRVLSADSGVNSSGLTIAGAGFSQVNRAPFPLHQPPTAGEIQINPCAEFDTYLAFGPALPGILGGDPIYDPTLNAQWFGVLVEAAQDPTLFNDNAYYVRLGRFTAPNNQVSIGGQIIVSTAPAGGGQPTNRTLSVPSWTAPNGGLITGDDGSGGGGDGEDDGDGDGGPDGDGGDSDDDGDGGPGGGGDGDGDDDGPTGDVAAISLVWHEIDNEDCAADIDSDGIDDINLAGARTFDLLVRSPTPDRLIGVSTGLAGAQPFRVLLGGPVVQFPGPENSNTLPSAADIDAQPCLAFDTYFAIGTTPDIMFLTGEPDEDNWPALVSAEWVTDATVIAQQDASTYGDSAYYARIMRITLGGPATVVGEFRLTVVPAGFSSAVQSLPISLPLLP